MLTLVAVPITCWICALIVRPRRPLPGNEVQELVHSRLCGKQQRLILLALMATITVLLLFLITASARVRPDPSRDDAAMSVMPVALPTASPSIHRCYPGDGRCLP